MIDVDRALNLVLENTPVAPPIAVALDDAAGLILAQVVAADRDQPPFARALRDGYAVKLADAGRSVCVTGMVQAGVDPEGEGIGVDPGCAVEIMTGAPCPFGTEAVVMREHVSLDGSIALLPANVRAGQHVAAAGSECARGTVVLGPGTELSSIAIAVLASFGTTEVRAHAPPSLAIVSTGDELAPRGQKPGRASIHDANGPMLAAQARAAGIVAIDRASEPDSAEGLLEALDRARETDIIVLSGGVSVGRLDLVPEVVRRAGGEVVFHGVSQKPGKPLLFARLGPKLVFGLPGNPLGSHACFERYVAAAARKWMGRAAAPRRDRGLLLEPLPRADDRTLLQLVRARPGSDGERWVVIPVHGRGSADVFNAAHANAYVVVRSGQPAMQAGTGVEFEWFGGAT
jgi:molybdopterin molybdotransferase